MVFKESFAYLFNAPRHVYCLWRISRLQKPIITVFGGKRASTDGKYYKQAYELGSMLVKNNMSILTGGGPGIMESALCGAVAQGKKDRSLGIGVTGIDVVFVSACGHETIFTHDFAARKEFLIDYSSGFIAFPGGIGTLDEILEVINLIKTNKIKKIPIVLIGTEYWKLFAQWMALAQEHDYIAPEHAHLFHITDDLDYAVNQMITYDKKEK